MNLLTDDDKLSACVRFDYLTGMLSSFCCLPALLCLAAGGKSNKVGTASSFSRLIPLCERVKNNT